MVLVRRFTPFDNADADADADADAGVDDFGLSLSSPPTLLRDPRDAWVDHVRARGRKSAAALP